MRDLCSSSLVLPAEARHDAEEQNDPRPRMSCLAIGIGTALGTLLEQFGSGKYGVCAVTTSTPAVAHMIRSARDEH